eukprot:gene10376-10534_t
MAHHALRQQLVEAQQVIERQGQKLKEKDSIILLLTDQLDRVSGMAAAVADEVQATRRTLASAASATPYSAASPLYRGSRQGSQSASPATKGRPGRLAAGMSYRLEGSPRGAATSPDLAGQLQHQPEESCPALRATMDDGEQQYDDRGEEQSPDEREAASHLLAFSEAAKASSPQGQHSPTVFASSRCGVGPREGCHLVPPSALPAAQEPWHMQGRSHIHWGAQPGLPAAPALQHILLQQAPGLVEAVAMMQTGLQAASGGVLSVQPQQEASGRLLLHCGQQGPLGLAGAPDSPLHHHHHHHQQQQTDNDVMEDRRRRSETQDATWGPNSAAAAPVNKKSKGAWFKQEISRIPASVQQACLQHWAMHQSVRVVCNDNYGTFVVNRAGEFLVKADEIGDFVSPNRFEEMAGKKTARNWQQSIRVVGSFGGGVRPLLSDGGPSAARLLLVMQFVFEVAMGASDARAAMSWPHIA